MVTNHMYNKEHNTTELPANPSCVHQHVCETIYRSMRQTVTLINNIIDSNKT